LNASLLFLPGSKNFPQLFAGKIDFGIFLLVMFVLGEFDIVANFERLYDLQFWTMMTIGGIFGVAIAIASTLQIKYTR
jgi:hypothetical protein